MKHLFFDLDRTLWDFERNSETALRKLYHELELDRMIKSFEGFHNTYKNHNAKLWNRYGNGKISKEQLRTQRFRDTLQQFQVFDHALVEQLSEGYITTSPHQTQVFPGTHDTLDRLKKDGYVLHIITNGFKEVQFTKLEKSGLLDYFDLILCSEEVGKNKPHLEVFKYAQAETGALPSESIMIGDDFQVDIMGATGAGWEGILFDPNNNYRTNTHEWQINELQEIPETIIWIRNSKLNP